MSQCNSIKYESYEWQAVVRIWQLHQPVLWSVYLSSLDYIFVAITPLKTFNKFIQYIS